MKTLKEARQYIRRTWPLSEMGGDVFRRPKGSMAPKYVVMIWKQIKGEGNTLDEAMSRAEAQVRAVCECGLDDVTPKTCPAHKNYIS